MCSYHAYTEGSGPLAPLVYLVDGVLAVPGDSDGVLDDPGVAVTVADEERLGILAHRHSCRLAVMAEITNYKKRD